LHINFTGLGREVWCPVITMYGEGDAVEVLPFSHSRACSALVASESESGSELAD